MKSLTNRSMQFQREALLPRGLKQLTGPTAPMLLAPIFFASRRALDSVAAAGEEGGEAADEDSDAKEEAG